MTDLKKAMKRGKGCIENMRCPKCGHYESFSIESQSVSVVYADGIDEHADVEWGGTSWCMCRNPECFFEGAVNDFMEEAGQTKTTYTIVSLNGSPNDFAAFWEAVCVDHIPGTTPEDAVREFRRAYQKNRKREGNEEPEEPEIICIFEGEHNDLRIELERHSRDVFSEPLAPESGTELRAES